MSRSSKKAYLVIALGLAAVNVAGAAGEQAPSPSNAQPAAASAQPAARDFKSSRQLWSWQQVQEPSIPNVAGSLTPIDAFILKTLEEKGLQPSERWPRNLHPARHFGRLGPDPHARSSGGVRQRQIARCYEKLRGPAAGLAALRRAADACVAGFGPLCRQRRLSAGRCPAEYVPLSRLRDNAFNQDKPFDRFIKEQIAGDELAPEDQDTKVATGFLAGYPDNRNSRDLVGRKYQITTDMTDTIGSAVLGTSFACARCHNHKFDKISQKDYFSFQAFFANTAFADDLKAKKGEVEKRFDEENKKYLAIVTPLRDKRKALIDPVRKRQLSTTKSAI